MTWVGRQRASRYASLIRERTEAYDDDPGSVRRCALQLESWNRRWSEIVAHVPYYRDQAAREGLPERFQSWEQFIAHIPPVTRGDVQRHKRSMTRTDRPADHQRMTGGSTAEPIQIPAWNTEVAQNRLNMWVARGWFGVDPASRLFMLWGHSHLLGQGWRGWINARVRQVKDRLVGCHRFSAYNLEPSAMRRAGESLLRFRPDYLIGYSVALDLFARANRDRAGALKDLGLKMVVGAAEAFPARDSEVRLRSMFGSPVAMEYGSVETGLIGHTHPSGVYRVFWRSYFVEAEKSPGAAVWKIRVTSLYPRAFPLVRYELGDEIELEPTADRLALGVAQFPRVVGRCNDYVTLSDGAVAHSEIFTHAVRPCEQILSYQVVQRGRDVTIRYVSREPLPTGEIESIRRRLGKAHPDLAQVAFERVELLRQTVAGKTRMVVRDPG